MIISSSTIHDGIVLIGFLVQKNSVRYLPKRNKKEIMENYMYPIYLFEQNP